jgi:hypothetical protein
MIRIGQADEALRSYLELVFALSPTFVGMAKVPWINDRIARERRVIIVA